MADVKIQGGNNRQCDLLAYNLVSGEQYHVESSVTHQENWCPSMKELREIFDKKYLGIPPKLEGINTDYAKGKTYYEHITKTYKSIGFDLLRIKRVFVTWRVANEDNLGSLLTEYEQEHSIKVDVLSFRDKILPELMDKISTSNYDDEVLRTLSLLRQRALQTKQT
jgi:hypothetical protein